jgi:2-polyprenyl-3-methyl-5-hydroxy-6-metoxy-1,4-benzoquinol methylase
MRLAQMLKNTINKIGLFYPQVLNKYQYKNQAFETVNERPVEYAFVFRHLSKICPKTVLDVGTGLTALPHLMRTCGFVVTSIDNITDYWPHGMVNHHYHVIDDDITDSRLEKKFDFITCVSALEHMQEHDAAIKSMFTMLNPGGHIVLTFPYNEKRYVENVYKLPRSNVKELPPYVTQAYSRDKIDSWLRQNSGRIVEQEYWRFFTGEYWDSGDMLVPPLQVNPDEPHQITCLLLQKICDDSTQRGSACS